MVKNLKVIYKPKGRAAEYSEYALNIYNGCNFGCKYCFAPLVLKRNKEDFHSNVKERDNFLSKLESDCVKLKDSNVRVLLCFTCDPYGDLDLKLNTTRKVIELFYKYNINFQVLTKGGMRAARDFDLYKKGDAFASTLTFLDEELSKEWEPNAPLPSDKIAALKKAHSMGIETWVSLEPVVDPEETINIIKETHDFVDLYKVGTLNYHEKAKETNWEKFAKDVVQTLESYNKNYYIKDDLKKFL